jgi:hypothetical protein
MKKILGSEYISKGIEDVLKLAGNMIFKGKMIPRIHIKHGRSI